jgi:hypothetical protein
MHYYCGDASVILYVHSVSPQTMWRPSHIARRVLILVAPYSREMGRLAAAVRSISRGKSENPKDDVYF